MSVMCRDSEEWCKNWREIDLSVQNGHEEFDKFWPKHLKISKFCTPMGFFWPKYIMLEIKSIGEYHLEEELTNLFWKLPRYYLFIPIQA